MRRREEKRWVWEKRKEKKMERKLNNKRRNGAKDVGGGEKVKKKEGKDRQVI